MAGSRRHAADLAVPSFDEADFNPEVRDIFSEPDRGHPWSDFGLGIKEASFCGAREFSIQRESAAEEVNRVLSGLPLHQHEIRLFHVLAWREQAGVRSTARRSRPSTKYRLR